jgi:hypothetical protein
MIHKTLYENYYRNFILQYSMSLLFDSASDHFPISYHKMTRYGTYIVIECYLRLHTYGLIMRIICVK